MKQQLPTTIMMIRSVPDLKPRFPVRCQQRLVGVRVVCCCSYGNKSYDDNSVPKLEPFSRTGKMDRIIRDPPLIKKTQNQLAGNY